MTALRVVLAIVWLLSGIATVAFILMHSGRGTGVSDMLGASMMSSSASLGIVEKNLDRVTIIALMIFVITLAALMFLWPLAPISAFAVNV